MRKILQISLLLIVVAGVLFAVLQNRKGDAFAAENGFSLTSDEILTEANSLVHATVVVTYFTTDVRCTSCRAIEAQTKEVVEKQFADALAAGSLVFQTRNIDREENKHFIDEYQLSFKTVVISSMEQGKEVQFVKMDKVWELLNKPRGICELHRSRDRSLSVAFVMSASLILLGSACWLGIVTSISPCPLATNVAAVSYLSR